MNALTGKYLKLQHQKEMLADVLSVDSATIQYNNKYNNN